MIMRLRHYWQEMWSSFWFVPAAIVFGAVGLASVLIAVDATFMHVVERWPLLFGAGAAGSRGLLTAVASSMITVAGVVFSITIVALSLTSSQYTSRVLRNFMRDRVNQVVLGLFVGVFAYYVISRHRTVQHDAAFGIRQIVDIALKALSPGINDTTTAVMCVDYLAAILVRIAVRRMPASHRLDQGVLRVIARGPSFESLLAEAFDQIRQNAAGNVAIMSRMLGAIQTIASLTTSASRRRALREQVQSIAELAGRTVDSPYDRARFESRLMSVHEALKANPVLFVRDKED
ncbi:MAG: DUF2254 domain-containing protein [Rhodopirellula sp.]|nr:DUF2254 domain-containing protein [Rhodopirellula sp.]